MATTPDHSGHVPADLEVVADYPGHRDAHERGLVALSMGVPYWVLHSGDCYFLLVEAEFSSEVRREVAVYDDEVEHSIQIQPQAPAPGHAGQVSPSPSPATIGLACLYGIALVIAFFYQKTTEPWSIQTFGNDTLALFDLGEWWRPATALALHGDLAHLLGNIAFGAWFGVLAALALGPAMALLTILLGGILGNTLAAAIYYPDHRISIGASTAVFAALGVLVGNGLFVSLRNRSLTGLASRLAPLAGGLALLALTGTGGGGGSNGPGSGDTDLLAHLCGFAVGVPLGVGATTSPRQGFSSG